MKVTRPTAVRDLYDDDLRQALEIFSWPGSNEDQDIVAISRSIVNFPDEDYTEHRYDGDFYRLIDKTLWMSSIGGMKPVWRPHAKNVGQSLRNCDKLRLTTGVTISLGRNLGLTTNEVTLHCCRAGVVWRHVGPDWNTDMTDDDEIEFAANVLYGAYFDEVALARNTRLAIESLSTLMTGVKNLDAYGIMGEATGKDDPHARLANRMAQVEYILEPWYWSGSPKPGQP